MTNVNDFKLMKRKLQRIIGKSCQAIDDDVGYVRSHLF